MGSASHSRPLNAVEAPCGTPHRAFKKTLWRLATPAHVQQAAPLWMEQPIKTVLSCNDTVSLLLLTRQPLGIICHSGYVSCWIFCSSSSVMTHVGSWRLTQNRCCNAQPAQTLAMLVAAAQKKTAITIDKSTKSPHVSRKMLVAVLIGCTKPRSILTT